MSALSRRVARTVVALLAASIVCSGFVSVEAAAADTAGHQVLDEPRSSNRSLRELTVTTPEVHGDVIVDASGVATPRFAGIATPGARVEVVTAWQDRVGSAVADTDGRWEIRWNKSLLPARYVGGHTIQHVDGAEVDRVGYDFRVTRAPVQALSVTSPTVAGTIAVGASGWARPTFEGTATPGAEVRVITAWSDHVGSAVADPAGAWSITWSKTLLPARYVGGRTEQRVAGAVVDSVVYDFTVAVAVEPAPSLDIRPDRSIVRAAPTGTAETERQREGRWFRHSDLQATGRYVTAGSKLSVSVPETAPGMTLRIGLYGPHSGQNAGASVGMQEIRLNPGRSELTAERDGMVYLTNTASGESAVVSIEGALPVPTFVTGETSNEEFAAQLERFTEAPFVEVVGQRVIGAFQRPMAQAALARVDVTARVAVLDDVVTQTDRLYGFTRDAEGVARKGAQRVYIANPDSGAGYASAQNDHITFQNATAAGRHLLSGNLDDQWGFYHEVGHTYQPAEMRWAGMVEVSVNISSLAVQESQGFSNRLDNAGLRGKVAQFRETPVGERSFSGISDVFLSLLMFDQLRRGFGEHFYAQLAQELRIENALGVAEPTGTVAVQQHFMMSAARVADRDLTPFFEQWGFPIDESTRAEMSAYPPLAHQIWTNHDRATDIVEREVPPLDAPSGTLSVSTPVDWAQRDLEPSQYTLSTPPGVEVLRVLSGGVAGAAALVQGPDGDRNAITAPVTQRPGHLISFFGLGDSKLLDVGVFRGQLRAVGSSWTAHSYFGGSKYLAVELRAADGSPLSRFVVTGNETAQAVAAQLDGMTVPEGGYVVAEHEEPKHRLKSWIDSVQTPSPNGEKVQAFRVVNGFFEVVGISSIPGVSDVAEPGDIGESEPSEADEGGASGLDEPQSEDGSEDPGSEADTLARAGGSGER